MSILALKCKPYTQQKTRIIEGSIYLAGILGGSNVILCKMLRTVTGAQLAQDICNYSSVTIKLGSISQLLLNKTLILPTQSTYSFRDLCLDLRISTHKLWLFIPPVT